MLRDILSYGIYYGNIIYSYFLQQERFILRHIRFFVFLLQHQYPRFGFIQHVSLLPFTRRHLFNVLLINNTI
jgi:hypothetical protein